MKAVYETYAPGAPIPAQEFLTNRKIQKYFNRETSAAVVAFGRLFADRGIDPLTSVFYSMGVVEFEDFGLPVIYEACRSRGEGFSEKSFLERGMSSVSPLTQFKILYNMPLCFVSIVYGLKGDNAVIYSSASGLLRQALCARPDRPLVIGAGKVNADGSVESGFAVVSREEIAGLSAPGGEAIALFREWGGAEA